MIMLSRPQVEYFYLIYIGKDTAALKHFDKHVHVLLCLIAFCNNKAT
jgi:hypothetical protein